MAAKERKRRKEEFRGRLRVGMSGTPGLPPGGGGEPFISLQQVSAGFSRLEFCHRAAENTEPDKKLCGQSLKFQRAKAILPQGARNRAKNLTPTSSRSTFPLFAFRLPILKDLTPSCSRFRFFLGSWLLFFLRIIMDSVEKPKMDGLRGEHRRMTVLLVISASDTV